MQKSSVVGHPLAFLTILIWGTTLVSTKVLLRYIGPESILVYRFALAYGLLLLACRDRLGWVGWRAESLFLGLGATGVTFYFWTENAALQFTLSANVGLIVAIIPILTALLAHFVTRDEKFHPRLLLGFVFAAAGFVLIAYNGQRLHLNPLGDLLALGAAISFSFYNVLIRKLDAGWSKLVVVRKTFFWGWLLSVPVWLALGGEHSWPSMNLTLLANLFYLAIFASVLGYGMWNKAVELIGAVTTSNYIYLMPVFTTIAGVWVLGEPLTWLMLSGGGLILVGVYVSNCGGSSPQS